MIRNLLATLGKILHKNVSTKLYAQVYEHIAPHYDQCVTRQSLAKETAEVIDKLELKPTMRCLDLGCGTGHATKLIDNKVAPSGNVVACDIAKSMLALAREKNPELQVTTFVEKEMLAMLREQRDASLDLVTSFWAIDYNSEIGKTLEEIKRVLAPNGQVAILVNTQESLSELQKIITKIFLKNIFALRTIPPVWVPRNLNKFKQWVEKASLEILELREQSLGYKFSSGEQLVAWLKTGGPSAGFKYFLKKKYEDLIFKKIKEEIDQRKGITITFKFIRFIGIKR